MFFIYTITKICNIHYNHVVQLLRSSRNKKAPEGAFINLLYRFLVTWRALTLFA